MINYLFIDRDGTLIVEPPDQQIDSLEKFALLPDVIPALSALTRAGFRLVMVTNQDGLGTPVNPREKFDMIQTLLLKILESQGIRFENVLICPHRANEGCRCRKPGTQLVRDYLAGNDMDRERSFVIGDRATDVELAENMGLKGYRLSAELGWARLARELLDRPRTARIRRQTNETDIDVEVDLDGGGRRIRVATGLGFFDHMLEQLARHGGFDLTLTARGDLHIDDHHVIEDVALALGAALRRAVGDKRGIQRYGFWLPMDEATTGVTLDLSGRAHFRLQAEVPAESVGGLSREMIPHFFRSLSDSLAVSLHIETRGENSHHMVESMFKGVGRSLRAAFAKTDDGAVPSTKGTL
jgi:imidazoleglycerol-phosphate dehydratase/histidinol-phosphatase